MRTECPGRRTSRGIPPSATTPTTAAADGGARMKRATARAAALQPASGRSSTRPCRSSTSRPWSARRRTSATRRSSFCSARQRSLSAGQYSGSFASDTFDSHYITPRFLAEELQWEAFRSSEDSFDERVMQVHAAGGRAHRPLHRPGGGPARRPSRRAPTCPANSKTRCTAINTASHRSNWRHTDE